jgi:hypothetical protein
VFRLRERMAAITEGSEIQLYRGALSGMVRGLGVDSLRREYSTAIPMLIE